MNADLLVVPSAFVLLLRAEQTIATRELTRLSLYKVSNCGISPFSGPAQHTSLSCPLSDQGISPHWFLRISEQSRASIYGYEGGLDGHDDHSQELRNP